MIAKRLRGWQKKFHIQCNEIVLLCDKEDIRDYYHLNVKPIKIITI